MARRSGTPPPTGTSDGSDPGTVVDIEVEQEMEQAFLEYAYSVIYSRALPDARDGLKPVQRRIVYQMADMGLRPDRGHVKSARVVGDVMGKLHPHGDTAIYDALVRLAQPFTMRLPLVDGHGNFGSLDAGPAAARYTEARPAAAALLMTDGLDEDVVAVRGNYDDSLKEPVVLPAAYPNLLVNGASGIAVGMATNMAPHNLVEVIAAARHLLDRPGASTEDLIRFVPGPDFPTGGVVVGLEGVREAYISGRGTFRIRGRCEVEAITARRQGIVVTELPYGVGPERFMEKVKEAVDAKRLDGISGLVDLSDRRQGMRVVVELKSGFRPEAVLEQLYRLTPLEESFGVNNVALVDGQPRTLGLRELLSVYLEFRIDVIRRRTAHRLAVAERDLHLVSGLLVAVLDIDEVIALIRSSDDAAAARERLQQVFDLSPEQAEHILEMRLRRLTRLSRLELEARRDELTAAITALRAILGDETELRRVVAVELQAVADTHGTPRRTVLLEAPAGEPVRSAGRAVATADLQVADEPCVVLLSTSGLLARTAGPGPLPRPEADARRARHDVLAATVATTARAEIGAVTSSGRLVKLPVVDLPTLPGTAAMPNLAGGVAATEAIELAKGEVVVGLVPLVADGPGLALGTRDGVVKRVTPDVPAGREEWELVRLADGDAVVSVLALSTGEEELVFVTSDAQLLHFSAARVRPQGRPAGGMAGISLSTGAHVVWFGGVGPGGPGLVVATAAGASGTLAGTGARSVKVSPFDVFPGKSRATGGVRCQRFVKGEDILVAAWVGPGPALGADPTGAPVDLPPLDPRRDGSGTPVRGAVTALGGIP